MNLLARYTRFVNLRFARLLVGFVFLVGGMAAVSFPLAAVTGWQDSIHFAGLLRDKPNSALRQYWEEHRNDARTKAVITTGLGLASCALFVRLNWWMWRRRRHELLGLSWGAWLIVLWFVPVLMSVMVLLKSFGVFGH